MTSGDAGAGQRELIDALVRSSFEVMAVLSRIGAEHDLSLTQLRVLGILRDRRIRMSELAGYLGLDKSTVSGLVDRAEKRGLVQRAPSPADGRAVEVFLTAAGTEFAERGAAQLARALSPMTGTLTAAQARQLTALLERCVAGGGVLPAAAVLGDQVRERDHQYQDHGQDHEHRRLGQAGMAAAGHQRAGY
jgi:DNA-binding MarR family transcriptional regulator